ncbi:DUF58 domain-containing protein [Rhodocytophaga rosea]|uniref:DUF58 domain-containing protein n=1 Tax=Rhodocytophaga rosea TaxID=2704465 RepID=A0A6C0GHE6_9BACT|nr:DUF58 domain-containing protein [Rhodocytophaga rosea]QHT67456.1 DUF58 domain-containing protein [Rhodocytophaga rosea]
MKDVLARLRKYEIRIRKAVNSQMRGDYHSVFKGSGLEFDDVRAYQYGDDVRTIDWNVSAKGHGTFIKIFREEKEQTVFFLMDVSASQQIGQPNKQKIDVARDICGVLALSAVKETSQVGLICFSDQREAYMKPAKGLKHGYELILNLFNLVPVSIKTNLSKAIAFALQIIKRRSVIILISDFIDTGYEAALKSLARKHDLVIIHLSDRREINLPKLGIIPVYDKETRRTLWVDTSSKDLRKNITGYFSKNQSYLERFCRQNKVNYLFIDTSEDFVPKLVRLFKVRNVKQK